MRIVIAAASLALTMGGCGGDDEPGHPDTDAGPGGSIDAAAGADAAGTDAAAPHTDAAVPGTDAGTPTADASAGDEMDCFGTRALYPLAGREWCLPADGHMASGSWEPDDDVSEGSVEGGVLSSGSPRHSVRSLEGEAWWRNVEMTVYLRHVSGSDEYTLYVRGGRHTDGTAAPDDINEGIAAPAGTIAWPGYPFASAVPWNCIGSAYKGYLDADGNAFFRKEISHTSGYTDRAAEVEAIAGGLPDDRFVGVKFVVRNYDADTHVHLELWLDREADGTWELVTSYDDEGGWTGDPAADGCDEAPLAYAQDQILTWAGPTAVLRTDASTFEFRSFSVREISPLP